MEERLDLSTWSIRDVMDGTFRMYRKHFLAIWLFAFIINFPFLLLEEWIMYRGNESATLEEQFVFLILADMISLMIIYPLVQNGLIALIHNQEITVKTFFQSAKKRLWKILLANGLISAAYLFCLLFTIAFFGIPFYFTILEAMPEEISDGTTIEFIFYVCNLAALLPWAYIYTRFALVTPFLNVEKRPFWNAFKLSAQWVKKDSFRILGAFIILSTIQFIFLIASVFFFEMILLEFIRISNEMLFVFDMLIRFFITNFIIPMIPLLSILLYIHYQRIRSGTDLIQLLERVDQRSRNWNKRVNI